MIVVSLLAAEQQPPNVLEYSFLGVLALMSLAIGVISTAVLVRIVEPRGLRVFVRRLRGKA